MICKGEVYRLKTSTDSQQDTLVLVVSSTASNLSDSPKVSVLVLVPRPTEVEPDVEVAFEVKSRQVVVSPNSPMSVPKEALEDALVGKLDGPLLAQIDKKLASYLALSPTSSGAPSMMTRPEKKGEHP